MRLTDGERAMLDGADGEAVAAAMDLLVRYGEVLGAERLVDTDNVCGANLFGSRHSLVCGSPTPDAAFSEHSLDAPRVLTIPPVRAQSYQLIGPMDTKHWQVQGLPQAEHDEIVASEKYSADHGIHLMNTCTPYQVGNVPVRGEHCAWMESSAVVYVNSVLGARTNVEGRESTGAAMLTGKIPYWGLHLEENRHGTHLVEVTTPVQSNRDWGLLGYWIGEQVQEEGIPVLDGITTTPDLVRLKHFGAAAASSGGVELYHVPGITAEARSVEEAFAGAAPRVRLRYGPDERRAAYERLNGTATDTSVDLVMIGCPHATLGQIRDVVRLLEGRRVHPDSELWVFTPRALRHIAEQNGYAQALEDAGAVLMSDTCPAIGQFLPKGTRVIATDSAKQVHYLPAIMNVQGWFGTLAECVDAAVTGTWQGVQP
ncbi:aconitase X [Geodermatophilus ruber]|uniref:Predicted aconitase subunit 1 n=1 Tax=Geodermatophilus ruber TaxID=504800 RepID=A0A1I4HQ96_9ACTN|nr:aconitase X catalytic domain-containing protein [Geodermatophilus ruber]SFL44488.1 predicted aconitase subunit 1 [Geodermatophilus ruber]